MSGYFSNDPWLVDGGPAFPASDADGRCYRGMSLRDFFAAYAMSRAGITDPETTAERAYVIADAMLAEREKSRG